MKLFSSLDLEFIKRSLSRNPSKKELKILYQILEPVLHQREMLPPRFVQQIGPVDQNVKIEIRDVKDSGHWISPNYLIRNCVLHGSWPIQLSYIWLFKPSKVCLANIQYFEEKMTESFSPSLTHYFSHDAPKQKTGKVIVVASMEKESFSQKIIPGQLFGYVSIPKPGKSLMNEKRIMNIIKNYNPFVTGLSLSGNCGNDLRRILSLVPQKVSLNIKFPNKYKRGDILFLSNGRRDNELNRLLSEQGYVYDRIGSIEDDLFHTLNFGDDQERKWPVSITRISIHAKENEQLENEINSKSNFSKKSKKINTLKIVKEMIVKGNLTLKPDAIIEKGFKRNVKIVRHQTIKSFEHSLFNGTRSIANVVRQMAMMGSNIESLSLISNIDNSQFLTGQQSVISSFGFKNVNKNYLNKELLPNQHQIIAIGNKSEHSGSEILDSDFISLLGSAKGELENSLFQDLTGQTIEHNAPVFDSTMEYNINQTLVQAVSTDVIKKVTTISKGGLAISLLSMYLALERKYGIKTHISRKLKSEELLFGESFGAALVVVGEKELMEFQRICMTNGIPCSTIGRLQTKQEISVNDILKIPEIVLNSLPT